MFIPKSDIYKTEWLDLIFQGRNKSYGAYELRKQYASTLLKSMGITAMAFLAVFLVAAITSSKQVAIAAAPNQGRSVFVDISKQIKVAHTSVGGHANPVLQRGRVANQDKYEQNGKHVYPYTQSIPLIHHSDNEVPNIETVAPIQPVKNAAPTIVDAPDEMPQPAGGKVAWAEYLKQNLRYPDGAASKNLSGKVWLSFVVEPDGKLSDIQVMQSAGNGFDEEAVRVVNNSPIWQPGLQNGQPVRVRYNLPINFHIVK